jgi:hypothetical protein
MQMINLNPRLDRKLAQEKACLVLKLDHLIERLKKLITEAFRMMLETRWLSRDCARRTVFYRQSLRTLRHTEDYQSQLI